MRPIATCVVAVLLALPLQPAKSQSTAPETEAAAVLERFHAALRAGDAQGAAALLAADAVILEGGDLESRQHYLSHHLAEDIKFARVTVSKRENVKVIVSGEVAWVTAAGTTEGEFQGKPVNLVNAELAVLTRASTGWVIRAIHWSSHKKK